PTATPEALAPTITGVQNTGHAVHDSRTVAPSRTTCAPPSRKFTSFGHGDAADMPSSGSGGRTAAQFSGASGSLEPRARRRHISCALLVWARRARAGPERP